MAQFGETWQRRWARFLVCSVLALVICVGLTGSTSAQEPPNPGVQAPAAPEEKPNFFMQILRNLFSPRELMRILGQPEYTIAAIVALNIIVFVETGLLIGFCLPGDSLLVTAGIVCAAAGWPLPILLATLCVSAIVGDSVGYSIGYKTGPRIFTREKSWFFRKDHLLAAQKFYAVHGGKTIILARFVPIIRTFAPVVAGVGKMAYHRFLFFNIFGGIGWVVSMILIGYFLTSVIEPPFRKIFGDDFQVANHIEKVIIIVVLLSISPGIYFWVKKKLQGKNPTVAVDDGGAEEVLKITQA